MDDDIPLYIRGHLATRKYIDMDEGADMDNKTGRECQSTLDTDT